MATEAHAAEGESSAPGERLSRASGRIELKAAGSGAMEGCVAKSEVNGCVAGQSSGTFILRNIGSLAMWSSSKCELMAGCSDTSPLSNFSWLCPEKICYFSMFHL